MWLTEKFMALINKELQIHILLNISGSKINQTIKLGQLIEYNKGKYLSSKIIQKVRLGH